MTAEGPILTDLLKSLDETCHQITASVTDVGTDPDTFADYVARFSRNVSRTVEMVAALQHHMANQIAAITTNPVQSRRSISESKSIAALKILGSDKSEFKAWNEKLINALAQTLGTPWRKFIKKPQ